MNRLIPCVASGFCGTFRLSAWLVLGLLLGFPAFKGVPAGYLPLLAGGALLGLLHIGLPRLAPSLERMGERTFLWILVLASALLPSALILVFRSAPSSDGFFVYREAVRLLETGQMNPLTYYAPAQVWYFALFFKLFGASPLAAQLCEIPLSAGIALLVYFIGRQAGSIRAARFAALGVVCYPGLALYPLVTPYYFHLYAVAILLMVFSWLRLQSSNKNWLPALWGGWAAGAGTLAKAVLLIAPLQTLFFLVTATGALFQRRLWAVWGLFILAMAATLSPWAVRNFRVFGEPVLVCTSGPLVLYSANNPQSNGLYSALPDEKTVETPREMLAHGAWCKEQAFSFIRAQPMAFARLVWLKLLHTWGTETSFVELINWKGQALGKKDPALRFIVQTGWAALVLAWAATAASLWRRHAPPTALEIAAGIFVLSKFVVYSVYEGGARHHLPAVPLLLLFVVCTWMAPSPRPGEPR